jgi:hypothetical protein
MGTTIGVAAAVVLAGAVVLRMATAWLVRLTDRN